MKHFTSFFLLLGLACTQCSQPGDPDAEELKEKVQSPLGQDGVTTLTTLVRFEHPKTFVPDSVGCQSLQGFELQELSDFLLDGDLSEWLPVNRLVSDPVDDADEALDLTEISAAEDENNNIIFGLKGNFADQVVRIVFGGYLDSGSLATLQDLKAFEIRRGQLFYLNGPTDQPIDRSLGRVASQVEGLEVFLAKDQLLEAVLQWPYWYVRFETFGPDGQKVASKKLDRSGEVFLQGNFSHSDSSELTRCEFKTLYNAYSVQFLVGKSVELEFYDSFKRLTFALLHEFEKVRAKLKETALIVDTSRDLSFILFDPTDEKTAKLSPESDETHYRVHFVNKADSLDEAAEGALSYKLYDSLCKSLAKWTLDFRTYQDDLVELWALSLCDRAALEVLGKAFWIKMYQASKTSNDLKSRARYLSGKVSMEHLLTAWYLSPDETPTQNQFALRSNLEKLSDNPSDLKNTWDVLFPQPNSENILFDLTSDQDGDGLENWFEDFLETSSDKRDTDEDGWADSSEWLWNTNPLDARSNPGFLVLDQSFSDWVILLPNRLFRDSGKATDCPLGSDIQYAGAVVKEDQIFMGMSLDGNAKPDEPVLWQAALLVKSAEDPVVVSSKSQEFAVEFSYLDKILRKERAGGEITGGAIEFLVDMDLVEEATGIIGPVETKVRFQTFAGNSGVLCDETDWLTPVTVLGN